TWTTAMLDEAVTRLDRWRQAAALPAGAPAQEVVSRLRAHLADDLDTAGALAAVDAWATETLARRGWDVDAPAQMGTAVDALLGIAL
ncbi:MAG: cysteine--1-D-myo-inosityl 2-amino-2-deoxy-alpha-D-glucopyranoside ligase, partial [Pseudonocardiaceae bacterium]